MTSIETCMNAGSRNQTSDVRPGVPGLAVIIVL